MTSKNSLSLVSDLLEINTEEHKFSTENGKYDKIIVLFPFGGRIDQTLSSMHVLCRTWEVNEKLWKHTDLLLMDSVSTMQYLHPGTNEISIAADVQSMNSWGIIPLMGKCEKIKTQGLKWNMGHKDEPDFLEFGGAIISTSNCIIDETVTIETSHPVVWTTTIKENLKFEATE